MKSYIYDLKFAVCYINGSYIITEPKQFIDVGHKEAKQLEKIARKHFQGEFGLIAHRINQSSIDPMFYEYAKQIMPHFNAFALVAKSDITINNYPIEQYFIEEANIQNKIFTSLNKAESWMQSVLKKP